MTVGSWCIKANSDIFDLPDCKNYWSDAKLIKAGGKQNGTLDFYQIHYYPDWGRKFSPFHNPASHWKLDKPLLIGECPAKGIVHYPGLTRFAFWSMSDQKTVDVAYTYAFDNGYIGVLGWQYIVHDHHGSFEDMSPGLKALFENHKHYIQIIGVPLQFHR